MELLPAPQPLPGPPDAPENSPGGGLLARLLVQAEASFRAARAGSTLRAYSHDWSQFRAWCEQNALVALPASPQTVILYSTDLTKNERKKWNTLSRRLAAISQLHSQAGFESPTRTYSCVENGKNMEVQISDNGVGIDPQNIKYLFAIEKNISTPGTLNEKGTGLGLLFCKELVEIQVGRIWAESEVGKGSVFKFTIPLIN